MSKALPATVGSNRSRILTHAVAETARHLEIGGAELGRIIGVSQRSRQLRGRTGSSLGKGGSILGPRNKGWRSNSTSREGGGECAFGLGS